MSDPHNTQPPDTPQSASGNLATEFKKLVPTIVLAVLTAFITSWWNSQTVQSDFKHRIELLEKKAEKNAENISLNSTLTQNNTIRIAELSVNQNNLTEQVRDLKNEQNNIKQMLAK